MKKKPKRLIEEEDFPEMETENFSTAVERNRELEKTNDGLNFSLDISL